MTDIRLEIISDNGALLHRLIDIPPSIVDETLSWKEWYDTLSYEEALPNTGRIWLLDLLSPRNTRIKYYAHVIHTLSGLSPYILLGEGGDSGSRSSGIVTLISSLHECSAFKHSEAQQLSVILRKVLGSRPETILQAITQTMKGLEILFCDGKSHLVELAYLKSLLGRGDDEIRHVAIGRDRTFIRIEFMDGSREFVPADMLGAESYQTTNDSGDASIRSAALTGRRIQLVRKKAMITQSELGERVGKSRHAIMRFESGQILPKVSDLELIAKAVRMDLLDLLSVPLPTE